MPLYKITLARSFVVTVESDNPDNARSMAELYLGYGDDSTSMDQEQYSFSINDIEMTMNEAIEAEEIKD